MVMKSKLLVFGFVMLNLIELSCIAQDKSLLIDNQLRNFSIKLPSNYSNLERVPMVLVLHGYNNEVKGIGEYTGFDQMAEKKGFIAVYPYGTINENGYYIWNAGNLYNEWTQGAKDVEFIDSLIHFMVKNYSIDEKKIFVVGHSNGSMMAYRLAAELSGKIAAAACVSGQMVDNKAIPEYPIAIMHIHGDADMVVPHTGTTEFGFQIPAIDEVIKKWLDWNHCSSIPTILTHDQNITALKWRGDAEVRLYLLHGQGHNWPSMEHGGWSATENIWNFFEENGKK